MEIYETLKSSGFAVFFYMWLLILIDMALVGIIIGVFI